MSLVGMVGTWPLTESSERDVGAALLLFSSNKLLNNQTDDDRDTHDDKGIHDVPDPRIRYARTDELGHERCDES